MIRLTSSNENRFPIWKLYEVINPIRSSCKYCSSVIATKDGNTSGLKKHMERFHPDIFDQRLTVRGNNRHHWNY
ncbi:unnamed protein product [Caenorhabditis brenneri]